MFSFKLKNKSDEVIKTWFDCKSREIFSIVLFKLFDLFSLSLALVLETKLNQEKVSSFELLITTGCFLFYALVP